MYNFFNQIRSSVYDKVFYRELENQSFSFTFKYLLKLAATISLFSTIIMFSFLYAFQIKMLSVTNSPDTGSLLTNYVENYFADDLLITFKDGKLSTNKETPTVFPIPSDLLEYDNEDLLPKNFVVISANEEFSPVLLDKYDTLGVMASSSLGFYDESEERMEVIDYTDVDEEYNDIVVDKDLAMSKAEIAAEYINASIPYIYTLGVLFVFLACLLMIFFGELLLALVTGLIAFLIAKFKKIGGTYKSWYLKSIHADTLWLVLAWTLGWIIPFSVIPLLNSIVVIVVLFVNDNFKK